jgi:hypothetical protein
MHKTALWIMFWGSLLACNLYGDRHKLSNDLNDKLGQASASVDVICNIRTILPMPTSPNLRPKAPS